MAEERKLLKSECGSEYGSFSQSANLSGPEPCGPSIPKKSHSVKSKSPSVSILGLFKYGTQLDWFLIVIGTIGAIANGFARPMMAIVFGRMTDSFLDIDTMDKDQTWQLTLIIVFLAPFLIITTSYKGYMTRATIREQENYAKVSAVAEEVFASVRTVLALCVNQKKVFCVWCCYWFGFSDSLLGLWYCLLVWSQFSFTRYDNSRINFHYIFSCDPWFIITGKCNAFIN
uniref:ABC transmembrane type-1 domain-containing protein n=1 Tax=Tetranychus urticae TaxID=32264 RepID=T1KQH8_TETUR